MTWLLALVCGSCQFAGLKRELKQAEKLAVIGGNVAGDIEKGTPALVVLWQGGDPTQPVTLHWIMHGPGNFRFIVAAPEKVCMMAFADLNGDLIYQKGEPAALWGFPSGQDIEMGQRIEDIRLSLSHSQQAPKGVSVDLSDPAARLDINGIKVSMGDIVNLEDERFSDKKASLGLWEPTRFLQEVGFGIYFLEPYDEKRMPVVFVHGVSGHPGNFKDVIEHLDRTRYQPWVFHYPSGVGLKLVSETLYRVVTQLQARHGFKRICVVAHSMGGLVSRGFMNQIAERKSPIAVPVYVTISTPWGGHEAAEMGVKRAPAVVPSWLDMVPNSPYQQSLWRTPLSKGTSYYLLFGYSGKSSFAMNRNNDGTVTIASQLDAPAQDAAVKVYGFNETHMSILSSAEVFETLNQALSSAP